MNAPKRGVIRQVPTGVPRLDEVLGEPPLEMLRYQQRFAFFDLDNACTEVRYVNLSDEVLDSDLGAVLARITRGV